MEVVNDLRHMGAYDAAIWLKFLEKFNPRFDRVEFDCLCGEGQECEDEDPDWVKRMVEALSCKRIDVVGRIGGRTCLIEVKQDAGLSAVGQLLGYKVLFQEENPEVSDADLLLVTDEIDDDTLTVCQAFGIPVCVVGAVTV